MRERWSEYVDVVSVCVCERESVYVCESNTTPCSPTDFKLVTPDDVVKASLGKDATLPCHLSPETSAVAMEIRWFKWTDCIYLYKKGRVTVREDYEGRVSVNTQELQRGDVSLRLREKTWRDLGVYTCQVISGEHKEEREVALWPIGKSPVPLL